MSRLRTLCLSLAALLMTGMEARAAEIRRFDRATFEAAQAQGRPILVDVKAWWCPVCASQNGTIKRAIAARRFDRLLILDLDYDAQKPRWRALNVRKQATLIGFQGRREVGRIQYKTDRAMIEALLATIVG